jgi:hypothetical protein
VIALVLATDAKRDRNRDELRAPLGWCYGLSP